MLLVRFSLGLVLLASLSLSANGQDFLELTPSDSRAFGGLVEYGMQAVRTQQRGYNQNRQFQQRTPVRSYSNNNYQRDWVPLVEQYRRAQQTGQSYGVFPGPTRNYYNGTTGTYYGGTVGTYYYGGTVGNYYGGTARSYYGGGAINPHQSIYDGNRNIYNPPAQTPTQNFVPARNYLEAGRRINRGTYQYRRSSEFESHR